jgi:hypothetical protein
MALSNQIEAERGGVPILTTSNADQIAQRGHHFRFKIPAQSAMFGYANVEYAEKIFADAASASLKICLCRVWPGSPRDLSGPISTGPYAIGAGTLRTIWPKGYQTTARIVG